MTQLLQTRQRGTARVSLEVLYQSLRSVQARVDGLRERIDSDAGGVAEELQQQIDEVLTELQGVEESLRETELRQKLVVQAAGIGFWDWDIACDVTYYSPEWKRQLGYEDHELPNEVEAWQSRIHPEDLGRVLGEMRDFLARRRRRYQPEYRLRHRDGTYRWILSSGSAVRDENGRAVRMLGLHLDITERKHTEQALRSERDFVESLIETAQAIVLVLDQEGCIVRFNRFLEELSGYSLEEVQGKSWFDTFLRRQDRSRIQEVFLRARCGESTRGVINAIVTRSGEEREIEWHDTPLRDAAGEIAGVLAVGIDITDYRSLEEEVRQAQKMEAVGRLAGGAAHDFNTLLASITGYGEMLVDGLPAGNPLRRAAEQILRSAQRGTGLTRQLLAFSRRQVLDPRVLDLNHILTEVRDMLDRLLGSDIEVNYDLDAEPSPVEVDAGQIEQVILNLAVNASDAMPQGGRMTLKTQSVSRGGPATLGGEDEHRGGPPGTWVVLSVEDTGCGMDSETLRHIFEPFFTTKEKGKGTGLGLSTVYGIVKQSGGDIAVESRPGRGTTFRIYLPRAAVQEAAEPDVPTAVRTVAAAPRRGSETVLVVEDDEMFRGLLAEILSAQGYEVLAASDPAEALERCQRHPSTIHLVVSDMVMPGMTGRELAWRLADRYPDVKICLMSGYSEEALAERGLSDPAVPVIQKPFSTRDFLSRIRRLLDEDGAA